MLDPGYFVGQDLDNTYRLLRFVGAGGFGWVYEAEELLLGQTVGKCAVKLVRCASDEEREAFLSEVRAMAGLDRPTILRYRSARPLTSGALSGCLCLCMELADECLEGRLQKPLGEDEVREIALALADSLSYLHGRQMIHRDIKPANIFRVGKQWKLGDLGLVQTLHHTVSQTSLRRGTLMYASPEVLRGQVGTFSDVWAFGVLLHEMLTGKPPFQDGTDAEVVTQIITGTPQIAPGLPHPWGDVLRGCLSREPSVRWAVDRIGTVLGSGLGGGTTSASKQSNPVKSPTSSSKDAKSPLARSHGAPAARTAETPFGFATQGKMVLTPKCEQVLYEPTISQSLAGGGVHFSRRYSAGGHLVCAIGPWTRASGNSTGGECKYSFYAPDGQALARDLVLNPVRPKDFAVSPDCRFVAITTDFSTVGLWEVATRTRAATLSYPDHIDLSFSSDGSALYVTDHSGTARISISTGEICALIRTRHVNGVEIDCISGQVAYRHEDAFSLWSLNNEVKVGCISCSPRKPWSFEAKNLQLAAAGPSGVDVYDLPTGSKRTLPWLATDGTAVPGPVSIRSLSFHPDGQYLAVLLDGCEMLPELHVKEMGSGQIVWSFRGRGPCSMKFSPDGRCFSAVHSSVKGLVQALTLQLWECTFE